MLKRMSTIGGSSLKRKSKLRAGNPQASENIENEIEMIDDSLFKISKLLMLCYGEAGASVVSELIRSNQLLGDFS